VGTQWFDRLSGIPQWSDGALWRFADGDVATGPEAPSAAFTAGSQVGVPTGTSLTPTVGLPAADATEQLVLVHPMTGQVAVRTVSVWRRRSWTGSQFQITPPSGATYLFDECSFENTADNLVVDVIDTNYTPDQMVPLAVFRRCQLDGNDSCGRAMTAGCVWLIGCHLTGTEDAWGGAYHSVAIESNFLPTTDGGVDPHQDGVQVAGIGDLTMFRCFTSAGTDPASNSAVRLGTDFSAIANVELVACTFDRGGYSLQVRGDAGNRGVTALTVQDCRWTGSSPKGLAGFGATDFEQVTGVTWTNNRFLGDNAVVPSPV
jgi:hypothetical protein